MPSPSSPIVRTAAAIVYGATCHALFVLGVGTMVVMMYFGMSASLGPFRAPWSVVANAVLLAQFPLGGLIVFNGTAHRTPDVAI